jgi:hypothetical protein
MMGGPTMAILQPAIRPGNGFGDEDTGRASDCIGCAGNLQHGCLSEGDDCQRQGQSDRVRYKVVVVDLYTEESIPSERRAHGFRAAQPRKRVQFARYRLSPKVGVADDAFVFWSDRATSRGGEAMPSWMSAALDGIDRQWQTATAAFGTISPVWDGRGR